MKRLGVALLFAAIAYGQSTVAPTTEPVGITRGENTAEYNVRQSFELGYRWKSVGGDDGTYRSMVNFGNGIRLLGSTLSINSREGHGHWFDQIQLNTQGLGNDPYQNALLRFEKNKLYRYDLSWRSTAYHNQGLYTPAVANEAAMGQGHFMDTVRNIQDHDVTFFPQGSLKFFLGFSSNTQRGPAISSLNFDPRGYAFPTAADVRRQQHEYRAGFELGLMGWRLNLMHGWVNFKDDTPTQDLGPIGLGPAGDGQALQELQRDEAYHGNSPYWRVMLFKETHLWAFNGRFSYVSGRRAFVLDETSSGRNPFGPITRQITTFGNAQRPALAANSTFSVFPSHNLTITNQNSLNNIRVEGNATFTQITNGDATAPFLPFTYLGILTISNTTDVDYRPARWLGVRTGYQYSSRRIRSIEDYGPGTGTPVEQTNGLHTGLLGIRLRPIKPLTVHLDAEVGRADRPIYPVSQRNFQAFRGRIEYRRAKFRGAGYARTDYNTNSTSLANFASRSRQYGLDGTWTLSSGFFIDAGYAKLHLDTLGALNYFITSTQLSSGSSYYVSNLHTATLAAHFAIRNRADISLGLSHVQDTGDGRAVPLTNLLGAAQTFPLHFTSPQGRLSVRMSEKVRWNVGYQNYGYHQEFGYRQNFHAHTGYSSISWSF